MGRIGMSMTIKQHVDHWLASSEESLRDMRAAFKSGRRMNAMYTGHLAVEKIFKALLAAQDEEIIYTHNLVTLAKRCGLSLTAAQEAELVTLNEFNIASKYASIKSAIYKRCTSKYTATWSAVIRKWQKAIKQEVVQIRAKLPDRTPASHVARGIL